jgi:hypothetical protein
MSQSVHFSVDTRLTRLLGEAYRSSEVALKELVDNAWDADALHVWITLPDPLTKDPIIVKDDGSGMTAQDIELQYLSIASDKRRRSGEKTPLHQRQVKGRKGIGKFAGLMIANKMQVQSFAQGHRCELLIDKQDLLDNQNDLEAIPLPLSAEIAPRTECGTTIILSDLDSRLNFPNPDKLREILIYEYGRENRFKVFVNDVQLSVQDVPGTTTQIDKALPNAGNISLLFTITEGKRLPKTPGVVLKVDGKVVGKPMLFGLDEDEEIPVKLTRKVFGEVDLTGLDEYVTADWSGMIENSKAVQEAQAFVKEAIKEKLKVTHSRDMSLQKARLQRQFNHRLQGFPEYRRRFAQEALLRIFTRFYGESDERITTIAEVALDAMEHDAYWLVLEQINQSSYGDVDAFAASLEQFGLLELSRISAQTRHRIKFLDYLDQLIQKPGTLEKDTHRALEKNLWVLGRKYSMMSSNGTLRNIIEKYCNNSFKGNRAAKRPDLLLSQSYNDSYLLIELKRPAHSITRDDIAQAEKYRDDLLRELSSTKNMEIMMVGAGRAKTVIASNIAQGITIQSYGSLISTARSELEWLLTSLSRS